MVSLSRVLNMVRCPVMGCLSVEHSAGCMREHVMYRNFFARIAVVQEGMDPLPRCDLCGMHMLARRLLKYQCTKRYDRNMQMLCRRKDVAIASRYEGEAFSLTGEDNAECIEGVETFKYLGRILGRSDNNWL